MKFRLFFTIIQFCFTVGVSSQTRPSLTLQQSIDIACDSSLQSFRTKSLYMASYWEHKAYKAARLPSLTLKMTPIQYSRDFTQRYNSETNMDVYREQQSLFSSGNLSIQQNFDLTGGTFFIDTELGFFQNF